MHDPDRSAPGLPVRETLKRPETILDRQQAEEESAGRRMALLLNHSGRALVEILSYEKPLSVYTSWAGADARINNNGKHTNEIFEEKKILSWKA